MTEMKPAKFLNKYKTIIFDMDGVITSEQNYWDIAALTVHELLNDRRYYGSGDIPASAQMSRGDIRREVFDCDRFIIAVKNKGVNSNWDLCYLAFCYLLGRSFPSVSVMTDYVASGGKLAFELYEEAGEIAAKTLGLPFSETKRGGRLWCQCRDIFQEWYLGDELFEEKWKGTSSHKGKPGMWRTEEPVVPVRDVQRLLKNLWESGKTLGIGTGRNRFEMSKPLESWDCMKYFTPSASIDYDYIVRGEENLRRAGITAQLTKPNPYMFLKALYGADYDDVKLYRGQYDKAPIAETLIVGDAGSDILAAREMGADFLAVLTGVNGENARPYFEELNAEYILPNVLHMIED